MYVIGGVDKVGKQQNVKRSRRLPVNDRLLYRLSSQSFQDNVFSNTVAVPVLMYRDEARVMTERDKAKFQAAEMKL